MERTELIGADGQDGYTPQKGIDYWTETEQNEIISTATTNVENNFASTIATIQSNSNNALNTANTANSTANTAKSIAEGANQALSYANYQAMIIAFNSLADDVYRIGQNVMIVTLNVPDLWISEIEQTSEAYTYTTDEAFTTLLQTNGYVKVGYYRLSPLETQKVDLTDYYTKEDTVSKISEMISVDDVQINGTSIVQDGVANVPIASASKAGVIKINLDYGINKYDTGIAFINKAADAQIKSGSGQYRPIVPLTQHQSVFYGLAKASGDTSQSASSNPVGNYTEDAKIAIQKMLGLYKAPYWLIKTIEITEETGTITIVADDNGDAFALTDVIVFFDSVVATGTSNGMVALNNETFADRPFVTIANLYNTTAQIRSAMLSVDGGRFVGQSSTGNYSNSYTAVTVQQNKNACGIIQHDIIDTLIIGSLNEHKFTSGTITIYGR